MNSATPKDFNRVIVISRSVRPLSSTRALGMVSVRGRSRVPRPAARIMAFMDETRDGEQVRCKVAGPRATDEGKVQKLSHRGHGGKRHSGHREELRAGGERRWVGREQAGNGSSEDERKAAAGLPHSKIDEGASEAGKNLASYPKAWARKENSLCDLLFEFDVVEFDGEAGAGAKAFRELFGEEDGAVLAAGAAERDHEVFEAAGLVILDAGIDERVNRREKLVNAFLLI